MLTYQSTRGSEKGVSASAAVIKGIADDSGLFVPSFFPKLPHSLQEYQNYSYRELAEEILGLYLSDFTQEEVKACVTKAYGGQFDVPEIAPVVKQGDYYFLELFHGPTYAFKDMALQILPELMKVSAAKQGLDKKILILTATSGDTGKAAMEGFADVEGTGIVVFYPKEGVSFIQESQMCTQTGENVDVIGIRGNFDDAQTGVKILFQDKQFEKELFEKGYLVSSANSINIGRLVPQIVYYIYAYARLLKQGELQAGEKLDVVVPTGNFGNILAAYYAKQMGLPIGLLMAASNDNKVINDFMNQNIYDKNREMLLTQSPSMDILVSSNLERLLYEVAGSEEVKTYMEALQSEGKYQISNEQRAKMADFHGEYATEKECNRVIREYFEKYGYLMDTHTAVAVAAAGKSNVLGNKTLIASTASPYKFSGAVLKALGEPTLQESFDLPYRLLERTGIPIPKAIAGLKEMPVRFAQVIDTKEMKQSILRFVDRSVK